MRAAFRKLCADIVASRANDEELRAHTDAAAQLLDTWSLSLKRDAFLKLFRQLRDIVKSDPELRTMHLQSLRRFYITRLRTALHSIAPQGICGSVANNVRKQQRQYPRPQTIQSNVDLCDPTNVMQYLTQYFDSHVPNTVYWTCHLFVLEHDTMTPFANLFQTHLEAHNVHVTRDMHARTANDKQTLTLVFASKMLTTMYYTNKYDDNTTDISGTQFAILATKCKLLPQSVLYLCPNKETTLDVVPKPLRKVTHIDLSQVSYASAIDMVVKRFRHGQ